MSQIILQGVAFIFFCSDIKQQYNYRERCVVISLTCEDKVSHLIQYKPNRVVQHDSSEFRLHAQVYIGVRVGTKQETEFRKQKACNIYKAGSIIIFLSFVLYVSSDDPESDIFFQISC